MAQSVGRGIVLLFHDRCTRKRVSGQQHTLAALYAQERHVTHFTGGWVAPRDGLDRFGKSRAHQDSIPDRPARSSINIPAELPGPQNAQHYKVINTANPQITRLTVLCW